MGHRIDFERFDGFGLLDRGQVRDLIDMFYRGSRADFVIGAPSVLGTRKIPLFGQHERSVWGRHRISICRKNIEDGIRKKSRMGGNGPAPDAETGAARVLVHEIQHANQTLVHSAKEAFYATKKYNRRPCERDARAFVDANRHVIEAFLGRPMPTEARPAGDGVDHGREIAGVADVLGELSEVTLDDIVQELRSTGLANPRNVDRIVATLRARGTRVRT